MKKLKHTDATIAASCSCVNTTAVIAPDMTPNDRPPEPVEIIIKRKKNG